jgi:hypothetical protein
MAAGAMLVAERGDVSVEVVLVMLRSDMTKVENIPVRRWPGACLLNQ